MIMGTWCVSSELHDCCLVLSKRKWKYTFSACCIKMVLERSRCRLGGSDSESRKSSTFTSDGSRNNAEHSEGRLGKFIFDIDWEPCVEITLSPNSLHKGFLECLYLTGRTCMSLYKSYSIWTLSIKVFVKTGADHGGYSSQPFKGQRCQLVTLCHPGPTYIFNFWHSGTLALRAERQRARMSEIKNVG